MEIVDEVKREVEKTEVIEESIPASVYHDYPESIQKPIGVYIIGGLNLVGGIVIAILGFVLLGESVNSSSGAGLGIIILMLGVYGLSVGIGLITFKEWARILAMIGYGTNIFVGLFGLPQTIFAIIIAGLILSYLASGNVKLAFEQR